MERKIVEIKSIEYINHDVLEIVTEKPKNYTFNPGQATDVAIEKEEWKEEKRPFTFTSLPSDDHLQFTIKTYPSHEGVTEQISKLQKHDKLSVGDVYGAIKFKGSGMFISGGAGITPFISILKSLEQKGELAGNSLLFANKTKEDIFLKKTLKAFLGKNYLNILSREKTKEYPHGHIDKDFLNNLVIDVSKYYYVCGPPKMTESVIGDLLDLGVQKDNIVAEDFNS
jgi:predicted ferric reductase